MGSTLGSAGWLARGRERVGAQLRNVRVAHLVRTSGVKEEECC